MTQRTGHEILAHLTSKAGSATALAGLLGVHPNTIANWRKSEEVPRLAILALKHLERDIMSTNNNRIWGHLRSVRQANTATTEELAVCDILAARLPEEQAEAAALYLAPVVETGALVGLTSLIETPEAAGALDARKYQDSPFCWWDWFSANGEELRGEWATREAVEGLADMHNALAAAARDGVTCVARPTADDDEAEASYYLPARAELQWTYPEGCEHHASVVADIAYALDWKLAEELMRSGDEDNAHLSLLAWMRTDHTEGVKVALEHWGRDGDDMIKRAEELVEELTDEWAEED